MCDKKKFNKKQAKEALFNAMMARFFGSERRKEIRYYWCGECNSYHLTSKPYVRQMISHRPALAGL
jgi:hypothetical protein